MSPIFVADHLALGHVLEHAIARQQLGPAVAVDVEGRHAFGVRAGTLAGDAGEHPLGGPLLDLPRIGRDVGDEERSGILVPVGQLRFARAFEVGHALVVVLGGAALLDGVALPGHVGLPILPRIPPPPDLVALPVAAEDEVRISVAVDVVDRSARLNRKVVLLDHVTIPAGLRPAIPHQGRPLLAKGEHEVVQSVLVEVRHHRRRLLPGGGWHGQIALAATQVQPTQARRLDGAEAIGRAGLFHGIGPRLRAARGNSLGTKGRQECHGHGDRGKCHEGGMTWVPGSQ